MKPPHRFADHRALGLALTLALIVGGGAWLARLPAPHGPVGSSAEVVAETLQHRFDEAVMLLHARRYGDAEAALRQVLALAPGLPEAHVNLGFSLLGLHRAAEARQSFEAAINLRPEQANAYYGLALSHEAAHDLELAIGSMRSYLHLARQEEETHLARARAALWEWEAALGRQRAP